MPTKNANDDAKDDANDDPNNDASNNDIDDANYGTKIKL